MSSANTTNSEHPSIAERADVIRLFGEIDEEDILQLLALQPTVMELQEAAAWLEGEGDILARAGHPMTPRIAGILEIVDRRDEEDAWLY
jgi:hypothetical protein